MGEICVVLTFTNEKPSTNNVAVAFIGNAQDNTNNSPNDNNNGSPLVIIRRRRRRRFDVVILLLPVCIIAILIDSV
jgi:hypothetical protein